MEPVPVSVVVVSRARPRWLARCLTGIARADHRPFEVVVVACPAGCEAVRAHPKADEIKLVAYDQDNISAARNRGIAALPARSSLSSTMTRCRNPPGCLGSPRLSSTRRSRLSAGT